MGDNWGSGTIESTVSGIFSEKRPFVPILSKAARASMSSI